MREIVSPPRVVRAAVVVMVCVLGCFVSPSSGARAQDVQGAVELFRHGAAAYGTGRYAEAAELFERAYTLSHDGGLLYNLGLARQRANDVDGAIEAYRAFLAERPDAPERTEVEVSLDTLEQLRAERAAEHEEPAPETTEATTSAPVASTRDIAPSAGAVSSNVLSPAPFVVLGLGLVTLGAAIAPSLLALDADQAARRTPVQIAALALASERDVYALVANAMWIAGGVMTLAGASWTLVEITSGPGSSDTEDDAGVPGASSAPTTSARLSLGLHGFVLDGRF